jgi:hypothetical protein
VLSCPNCGARAAAKDEECAGCGYRFVEDSSATNRRRFPRRGAQAAILVAVVFALAAVVATRGGSEAGTPSPEPRAADRQDRSAANLLSDHPLSARGAERRLEAWYASPRDHDIPTAHCSPLRPKPAHAIRFCEIRSTGGIERTVVVLSNPHGQELLIER